MYTKKTFIIVFSYQEKMFWTRTSFFPKGKRLSRKENLIRKSKPKKKGGRNEIFRDSRGKKEREKKKMPPLGKESTNQKRRVYRGKNSI